MSFEDAAKIEANTEEFDAAIDLLSDLAAAGDKEACKVLKWMLTRNDDFLIRAR